MIGLPPEQFAAAFPFHFALDAKLKFCQVGATLGRICPDIRLGAELNQIFQAIRPQGQVSLEWIEQNRSHFFLLEHQASHLLLRGEFMLLPDTDILLFLGSPWFTDPQEIVAHGLRFEDFAIHDPAVDLLQVFQANKISLEDAKRLADKLKKQRAELRAVNERLRQQ